MNTSVLKIGDKAIIQKKTRRDENEYTSQIQDIKGNTLRISTPMYRSALIRLQEKTRIEVLIYGDGKVYEATNQAGFDQLHQAAIKNSRDVYEPIAEALSTVAKVLEEMADRTEEVNKSSVSI